MDLTPFSIGGTPKKSNPNPAQGEEQVLECRFRVVGSLRFGGGVRTNRRLALAVGGLGGSGSASITGQRWLRSRKRHLYRLVSGQGERQWLRISTIPDWENIVGAFLDCKAPLVGAGGTALQSRHLVEIVLEQATRIPVGRCGVIIINGTRGGPGRL